MPVDYNEGMSIPQTFFLPDSAAPAESHNKFAHSALNRAEEMGMGFTPRLAMLWDNLLRFPTDTQEAFDQLERTTRTDDWQASRLELPQLHALPTGILVARERIASLELLLSRGALVSWPTVEELCQENLAGAEDTDYQGVLLEPLAEATRRGFWNFSTPDTFFRMRAALEGVGADPMKEDLATGRSAFDEMLVGFESLFRSQWAQMEVEKQAAWVEILAAWFPRAPTWMEALEAGQWDGQLGPLANLGIAASVRARLLDARWPEPSLKASKPRF